MTYRVTAPSVNETFRIKAFAIAFADEMRRFHGDLVKIEVE